MCLLTCLLGLVWFGYIANRRTKSEEKKERKKEVSLRKLNFVLMMSVHGMSWWWRGDHS